MSRRPREPVEKMAGPRQARGRFISRSIATSEQLGSVSLLADYLFRSCIPHLDVTGRMTGNPGLIKAAVAPLRDEIHSGNLPELLRELAAAVDHNAIPLVFWYEIGGAKVLEFPAFSKHQTGLRVDREAPSKFPQRNGMEKFLNLAGLTPELLPQNHGGGTAQDEVEVEGEVEGEVVKCEPPARNEQEPVASQTSAPRSPAPGTPPAVTEMSQLIASLEQLVGDVHWQVVHAFLRRRGLRTWIGWIREMLKLVGPGSQFTGEDLASVCSDDEAMAEPIATPYVLRTFLGTSRRERTAAGVGANRANGQSGPGERTYLNAKAALEGL
jgi:hypothetical protein